MVSTRAIAIPAQRWHWGPTFTGRSTRALINEGINHDQTVNSPSILFYFLNHLSNAQQKHPWHWRPHPTNNDLLLLLLTSLSTSTKLWPSTDTLSIPFPSGNDIDKALPMQSPWRHWFPNHVVSSSMEVAPHCVDKHVPVYLVASTVSTFVPPASWLVGWASRTLHTSFVPYERNSVKCANTFTPTWLKIYDCHRTLMQ